MMGKPYNSCKKIITVVLMLSNRPLKERDLVDMIRISGIKVDVQKNQEFILRKQIISILKIKPEELLEYRIIKRSLDARRKERLVFIYTIDAKVKGKSKKIVERLNNKNVTVPVYEKYVPPISGDELLLQPPIVVGMGPAGLFAAYLLAKQGYKPIVLERGQNVEQRTKDVEAFWQGKEPLNPESNVQFGEGGAGAFSDGKLTTLIKNIRCQKVLEIFVENGAPADILYTHHPHIGTDILKEVVKNMRQQIIVLGGQVRFDAKVTALITQGDVLEGVVVNDEEKLYGQAVILAVGHSARDTFAQLNQQGVEIVPKAFAIGLRIEHLQAEINQSQYGEFAGLDCLGAAEYKLTHQAKNGRSVYTFCMCPGGQVVAAASENGGIVTNGMSYHARNGVNANSAIVVGVNPSDFGSIDPLAGVAFQRKWEQMAYRLANESYKAPCQLVGDFLQDKPSTAFGRVKCSYEPAVTFAPLKEALPEYVVEAIKEAIKAFGHRLKGFSDPEAVLVGVETRTSSPIRILRNNQCQAVNLAGLYPCGEGAGYAGGIISAAVDGLRVAEEIIKRYHALMEQEEMRR